MKRAICSISRKILPAKWIISIRAIRSDEKENIFLFADV